LLTGLEADSRALGHMPVIDFNCRNDTDGKAVTAR
jgi:hypothetical protein